MNRLENLTKAQQCADLLVSDIRDAHRGVCVEKPTVADNLLECALLPLISEACALRDKLAALQRACETWHDRQSDAVGRPFKRRSA